MPLGGDNVLWDETSPPDSELAGLGATRIRSEKTSTRAGLNSEHNWPSTGGAGTGYHLYGSARPFYIAQSLVSSSGTDGRIAQTSDTSRLFSVGSQGTILYGDACVLSMGSSNMSWPQTWCWQMEASSFTVDATAGAVVSYTKPFSNVPYTVASALLPSGSSFSVVVVRIVNAAAGSFGAYAINGLSGSSATVGPITIAWHSIGTRPL